MFQTELIAALSDTYYSDSKYALMVLVSGYKNDLAVVIVHGNLSGRQVEFHCMRAHVVTKRSEALDAAAKQGTRK